uniref:Ca2+-binding actin-bundling protein n=1 Tax=Syphacia muris TaxID=451379 RepID=A0A0N5AS86_9BILA
MAQISPEQLAELNEKYPSVNADGSGTIPAADFQEALKVVGVSIPGYQVRDLLGRFGNPSDLKFSDFQQVYGELQGEKDKEVNEWKHSIAAAGGSYQVKGTASETTEGVVHTIRDEEEIAFSNWINSSLASDPDLKKLLPVSPENHELYSKIQDGLVLCKLINQAVPDTIDERAINKKLLNPFKKMENLTLALNSSQAIGCNIVNIDCSDLSKGTPHLVLGLLWQIIRIGLFNTIDLIHVPGLFRLLEGDETLEDLRKLSPEEILVRWVNYHIGRAGVSRRLSNFTTDITDSEIYTYLLHEIAPKSAGVTLAPLQVSDNVKRAGAMLDEAAKLECREFVTPNDVAKGVYKLNLAFVANLFNKHPNLPEPGADEIAVEVIEETREEKTYRNWMNSMGVNPYVNWLYSDLANGLIIFQLYEIIHSGIVDWNKVVKQFSKLKGMMEHIENCNYAVELGKQLKFSLVGIQGKDIYDGSQTLTLALIWQLMRAYTLTILAQCTQSGDTLATDKDIVEWANKKLESAGKSSHFGSFQDSTLSDGHAICDLVDAIQPGSIDYSLVKPGGNEESNLANAKYAITMGRKIGAKIYALPEDIVEVKSKMVMTVFACLMARDFTEQKSAASEPVGV